MLLSVNGTAQSYGVIPERWPTIATAKLDARLHVVGYWGVRRSFS
jgi:hypothetical protein